jgi:OmpA-OmpF porin, OOP family
MRKSIHTLLAALALLAAGTPATAQDADANPWYGGFAIGFSSSDSDCDFHGYNCDGDDTSFRFFGGKRLHENLAVELSFQDLGKLTDDRDTVTTTAETNGVNLSLLGIIPVSGLGYFYGKVGMMAAQTDYQRIAASTTRSDDDSTDFTYGAGFAFTFGEKYDFRIEFERLNELNDDFTPGGSFITVFSFGGTIYLY